MKKRGESAVGLSSAKREEKRYLKTTQKKQFSFMGRKYPQVDGNQPRQPSCSDDETETHQTAKEELLEPRNNIRIQVDVQNEKGP